MTITSSTMWWNNATFTSTNPPTTHSVCEGTTVLTTTKVLYVVLMSIVLCVSVCGNIIVIAAVVMSPLLKARQTFTFAASLAISDMIMSVSQIPEHILYIVNDYKFCSSLLLCYVRQYSDYLGNIASILNLFAVSLDRYIAIESPYKYFGVLTSRRCKFSILTIWMFSGMWGVSGLFSWTGINGSVAIDNHKCHNNNKTFLTISFWGIFMPVLAIITGFYVQILRTAISQIRKIDQSNNTTGVIDGNSSGHNRKGSQFLKELKTTKSIFMVYLIFAICWLPGAIKIIISVIDPSIDANMSRNTKKMIWLLRDILSTISMSSNPIIYSFSNSQFRKAVQSLYRKHRVRGLSVDFLNDKPRVSNSTHCDKGRTINEDSRTYSNRSLDMFERERTETTIDISGSCTDIDIIDSPVMPMKSFGSGQPVPV